ncbi:MAG: hypothetical protein KDD70_19150 [Bdellovibrionales bacterium]|nr:hypothetical protein [Bdellovibrionales bacterium]
MAVAGAQQAESPISTKGRIPGDEVSQQRAAFFALPLVITGFSALSYEMSLRLLLSAVLGSNVY